VPVVEVSNSKTRHHKASHCAIAKAMVLNGLVFNESRLFFYSNFFIGLATRAGLQKNIMDWSVNAKFRTEEEFYNFYRTYRSLKYKEDTGKTYYNCTAKHAGLIDHVWSMEQLLTFPYHKILTG
jgi:hypothetical protein